MRYRIRITRVQVAELTVRASSEDGAIEMTASNLQQPYGYLAR